MTTPYSFPSFPLPFSFFFLFLSLFPLHLFSTYLHSSYIRESSTFRGKEKPAAGYLLRYPLILHLSIRLSSYPCFSMLAQAPTFPLTSTPNTQPRKDWPITMIAPWHAPLYTFFSCLYPAITFVLFLRFLTHPGEIFHLIYFSFERICCDMTTFRVLSL